MTAKLLVKAEIQKTAGDMADQLFSLLYNKEGFERPGYYEVLSDDEQVVLCDAIHLLAAFKAGIVSYERKMHTELENGEIREAGGAF
jgi:hypothetical protein